MINILVIGKNSFIGSNLKFYLVKKYKIDNFSFEEAMKKKVSFFKKYTHIINTSIHKKYINKKYKNEFDLDKKFINRFKKIEFIYFFLNSRKIYEQKENISELSKISPIDTYALNKYRTENYLKKRVGKNLVSLRISNVVGKRILDCKRNNHKLFLDNLIVYRKQKKKLYINDDFKDFITIQQFYLIIERIIKLKITGIYNISLSKKVYVSEIVRWLDKNFLKNIVFNKAKKDSFTLSNKKIRKKIKINLTKRQLMLFCKKLI